MGYVSTLAKQWAAHRVRKCPMFNGIKTGLCWWVLVVVIRVMVEEGEAAMDYGIVAYVNVL